MYQTILTEKEAGQRLDKYLHRILPNAGSGFLYKMLRKKNITLNDKKADGSEKTAAGDCVKIFFAQETLAKFMGRVAVSPEGRKDAADLAALADGIALTGGTALTDWDAALQSYQAAFRKLAGVSVIYENDHVLIADKPAGVLSQKAEKTDLSLNEWLIGYLLQSGFLTADDLRIFKPSVCNRLDRNTSGIVLCAKSLQGAQLLGDLLKERTLHKYYQTYVKGQITQEQSIEGILWKDGRTNRVTVCQRANTQEKSADDINAKQVLSSKQASYIKTAYRPLRTGWDKTLLEVELITGKSHQIRAHLAGIGHPLLGDHKYGDQAWNETYREKCGVQSQLLHAYKVVFPPLDAPFADLSGRTFLCSLPEIFEHVSDSE